MIMQDVRTRLMGEVWSVDADHESPALDVIGPLTGWQRYDLFETA